MVVVSEDAGDQSRVQQLMKSLAGETGKHEAVPHSGGRAGEDGGHGEHRDWEEHQDNTLTLVRGHNTVQDVTEVGDTPLK